jgi:hypothetical protein
MRLAAGGRIAAAAIVLAAVLTSCEQHTPHTAHSGPAAARSRVQVVPAARELYQMLAAANARSVGLLDWGYAPCGTGTATLSYSVSLRLFAFADRQNTDFDPFRRQVVGLVRAAGWTLRQRPPTRSETLPTVPSAYYRLSRHEGKVHLSGRLGLVGDVNPLVGVTGTISVDGPCFDADGAAGSLQSRPVRAPFPLRSQAPSSSHS